VARKWLSNRQWRLIAPLLPAERGKGRPYIQSHRMTIEGILWIARTGAPWRDLPPDFGKWITVYQRFNRWTRDGVFDAVFQSVVNELELGVVLVDGTFVKVHQHGSGAPKQNGRPTNPESCRLSKPAAAA